MEEIIKKIMSERKSQQLFKIVNKIQEDSSSMDLEDYESVFDLLKKNNEIELKKRIWGHKFYGWLSESQKLDLAELEELKQNLK